MEPVNPDYSNMLPAGLISYTKSVSLRIFRGDVLGSQRRCRGTSPGENTDCFPSDMYDVFCFIFPLDATTSQVHPLLLIPIYSLNGTIDSSNHAYLPLTRRQYHQLAISLIGGPVTTILIQGSWTMSILTLKVDTATTMVAHSRNYFGRLSSELPQSVGCGQDGNPGCEDDWLFSRYKFNWEHADG